MINLILKIFLRNHTDFSLSKSRAAVGTLSGAVGIILNALLSVVKLIIGTMTNSISITADAVNNLSDSGTSAVSLVGFRLSSKPADKKHPYGHGRLEYICALIVSFIILLMGFELIKSSFGRILNPQPVNFSLPSVIVLAVSIFGKVWLALFNKKLGTLIKSESVKAVIVDSLSDIAATTVTIISLIASNYTTFPVDGVFGVLVAGFIFYAGIGILRDTSAALLGSAPEPKLVEKIQNKILSYDGIVGVHDLIVHDYGPGRGFITAHAEVSSDADIMDSHDTLDLIERELYSETGMQATLHLDPLVVNDEHVNALRKMTEDIVKELSPDYALHDFRVVAGPLHTNLIFDLVVPLSEKTSHSEIEEQVESRIKDVNEHYFAVITIESSYI